MKILRTYLITYSFSGGFGGSCGNGRAVYEVDAKLNSESRIRSVELRLMETNRYGQVAVSNLVVLKKRIGRLKDPVPLPAAPEPADA